MKKFTIIPIVLFLGCASDKEIKPPPPVQQPVETTESKKIEEIILKEKEEIKEMYTVKKGDCLWKIAGKKEIYNDPFMWPVIYEANRDKIKNPDLIYPLQKFVIPRSGISMEKIKEHRRRAGAPPPYIPPPDARIPQ